MTTISNIQDKTIQLNNATEKTVEFMHDVEAVSNQAAKHIQENDAQVPPVVAAMALSAILKRAKSENVGDAMYKIAQSEVHHIRGALAIVAAEWHRKSPDYNPKEDHGYDHGMQVLGEKWVARNSQEYVIAEALKAVIANKDVDTRAIEKFLDKKPVVIPTHPLKVVKDDKAQEGQIFGMSYKAAAISVAMLATAVGMFALKAYNAKMPA